ncbi:helix-turn-helix transcriptional regulator [Flavobacterium antarcticum]|uniref:helix-turn-helix domain-containing protein n=1 Tax=Flavobacterium antarcticum TaxID=271155 RepID=UPI0003B3003A|nr:helix-turn-helix transcriptional regulator [Flavobacterium antarcticum]
MLNTEDFIKRLEFIMDHYSLSASSFADKIGVQRSSISHLLSGRNKPSLDFVMKILDLFPELNLYWFLDGKGSYLKNDSEQISVEEAQNTPTPIFEEVKKEEESAMKVENAEELKSDNPPSSYANLLNQNSSTKQIDTIVFFYNDGTFYDYKPSNPK